MSSIPAPLAECSASVCLDTITQRELEIEQIMTGRLEEMRRALEARRKYILDRLKRGVAVEAGRLKPEIVEWCGGEMLSRDVAPGGDDIETFWKLKRTTELRVTPSKSQCH